MAKLVKLQDGMRDGGGSDDGSLVAESIAVIEALSDPTAGDAVYLNAGGRSGWFNFDASDLSSEVSSDTQQGIYIAPDADATGASGAWVRQYDGAANVKWFGAVGDGSTSDTSAIQASINVVDTIGGGTVYFPTPSANYRIDGPITIPVNVNFEGDSRYQTYFAVRAGTYPAGAAFLINTTDGTDWITNNPNHQTPTFKNMRIETDQTSLDCFLFNGSPVFEDMKFTFWDRAIVGGTRYNDSVRLERCHFTHITQVSTYQVDLGNTGDIVLINHCHFSNVANNPSTPIKSVKISNNGYAIRNTILGDCEFASCTSSAILDSCSLDGGQVVVINSNLNILNTAFSQLESDAAIKLDNTSGFPYYVNLDGVLFSHDVARGEWTPHPYEIAIDNKFSVTFNNVFKRTLNSAAPAARNLQGVKVSNLTGTALSGFNKYSYMYSQRSKLNNQSMRNNPFSVDTPTGALNLLGATYEFSNAEWTEASATYFYKAILFYDTGRLVGRNDASAEVSRAATNLGSAIGLDINEGNYPTAKIIRLYRGTSSGSYDAFADIPVVNANFLVDVGPHVSGVVWESRTAGGVDAFNNYTIGGFALEEGLAKFVATGAPIEGTWSQGDVVRHRQPAAGGNIGWVCTASGSPGTWKTYGSIAA